MNLTILCHEDWARTGREETTRFSAGSYMGYEDVRRFYAPEQVCALIPRPQPEALYQPVTTSPVPVLIISDQADPQNPPENVASAKEHYPNSLALVAPGQGHGYTGFRLPGPDPGCFHRKRNDARIERGLPAAGTFAAVRCHAIGPS